MGYYIEVEETKGKTRQIIGGREILIHPKFDHYDRIPEDKVLVCIVDNGMFEAAAVIFDEDEFRDFSDPTDPRFKEWILLDKDEVIERCPEVKEKL